MDLIKNWLSGRKNFVVGAILYKRFGTDDKLKKLFNTHTPDKALEARLQKELEILLEKPKVVLQVPATKSEAEEMPKSADPVLLAIRNEWMPLYQRMNYLRHELDRYEENTPDQVTTRKGLANEILELEQKCMQLWEKREHYIKHGQLPAVKEDAPVQVPENIFEARLSLDNIKRNLRRNKQLFKQHPDNSVYAQKVKIYESKLQEFMQQIQNPKKDESPGKQTGLKPGSDQTLPGK